MNHSPVDPALPALRQALDHQRASRMDQAEALYQQVLRAAPEHALALHLLGVLLGQTGRQQEGVTALRRSVALNPRDPLAHHNLAVVLLELQDVEAAARAVRVALVLHPAYGVAHCTLGRALLGLRQCDAALGAFDAALRLEPQRQDALLGRTRALLALERPAEACASAHQAAAQQPSDVAALGLLGAALKEMKQYQAAAEVLERALQLRPQELSGLGALMGIRMAGGLWQDHGERVARIEQLLLDGAWVAQPFILMGFSDRPEVQLQCARLQMLHVSPARAPLSLAAQHAPHVLPAARVKVAYLSADFHAHATAYLMAELFELHDRSRFETLGLSFGPGEDSALRRRIEAAFDHFHDVTELSDEAVARMLVDQGVDIVVDLKGFTKDARPGIFQFRPAPVVVNYLGYPGTLGAACYDYILGDPVVTPLAHAAFYSEKIVQLPHSYQVNDRQRAIAPLTPARLEAGLPSAGFVFACFNNNYKITPMVFGVWMRLLAQVPGSVLWLLVDNAETVANLRREAEARGIAGDRLVFAGRMPLPEHLARHRLADLFLDTLPCNAHTTASDALWAGLPVLTCLGTTFAGRVAASLLTAIGLPELITSSLDAYEALALQLASEPARLQAIRQKLQAQRDSAPLFDTPQFTAYLEKAYLQMVERYHQGLAPQALVIN